MLGVSEISGDLDEKRLAEARVEEHMMLRVGRTLAVGRILPGCERQTKGWG